MGIENIRAIKNGPPKSKKPYFIRKKSLKQLKKEEEEKLLLNNEDTLLEKWFKARRKEMTGFCQCGCGNLSSKEDNIRFRRSCAHIFPKEHFESIMYHPLNFVERAFWGGCHTNMDSSGKGMEMTWPQYADWPLIKSRFHILTLLLTPEEKAHKFYSLLEDLVDRY